MASYYGKRREFTLVGDISLVLRGERQNAVATAIEIEGIRIFVEQPAEGPAVLILQATDGQPLRVGALAVNTISLHRERT